MAAPLTPDLDELREKAEHVEELVTPPRSQEERVITSMVTQTLAERRRAWHRSVEDAVLDLSNAMPQGLEDYDGRKLFEQIVEMRRLLEADPKVEDPDGELELATMRAADIVRRIVGRLTAQHLDDPQVAVQFLFRTLAGIGVSEMAGLLAVSTKTIGAWGRGKPVRQNARRVVIVAQVVNVLNATLTPRGLMMWFEAARDQLDGRSPLELLDADEAAAHQVLLGLAQGGLGQLAD